MRSWKKRTALKRWVRTLPDGHVFKPKRGGMRMLGKRRTMTSEEAAEHFRFMAKAYS